MNGRAGPLGAVPRRFPDASDRLSVSLPGFFRTVYLTPRMRLTDFSSPSRRAWFHGCLLTLSGASLVQLTMWNPSGARSAFGHHSCTHESIHRAPSPATTLMEARCSGVNVWKNRPNTSLPYPSCAHIARCRSWSTTTVMHVWPLR